MDVEDEEEEEEVGNSQMEIDREEEEEEAETSEEEARTSGDFEETGEEELQSNPDSCVDGAGFGNSGFWGSLGTEKSVKQVLTTFTRMAWPDTSGTHMHARMPHNYYALAVGF